MSDLFKDTVFMNFIDLLNAKPIPLDFSSVEQFLRESNLSEIPQEMPRFRKIILENGAWLNECLSGLPMGVGRVALRSMSFSCAITALTLQFLGCKLLSKKAVYVSDLLEDRLTGAPSPPLVRTKNVFENAEIRLDFMGICGGASVYFNYLFHTLSQKNQYKQTNPKELLIRCANTFIEGGKEAALRLHYALLSSLQAESNLLTNKDLRPGHILRLFPDDDKSSVSEGKLVYKNQKDLKRLSKGSYLIRMYNFDGFHILSLVIVSKTEWFLFDPSYGLFEFTGRESYKLLMQHINGVYGKARIHHYQKKRKKSPQNTKLRASAMREMYMYFIPMSDGTNFPKFPSQFIRKKLSS